MTCWLPLVADQRKSATSFRLISPLLPLLPCTYSQHSAGCCPLWQRCRLLSLIFRGDIEPTTNQDKTLDETGARARPLPPACLPRLLQTLTFPYVSSRTNASRVDGSTRESRLGVNRIKLTVRHPSQARAERGIVDSFIFPQHSIAALLILLRRIVFLSAEARHSHPTNTESA